MFDWQQSFKIAHMEFQPLWLWTIKTECLSESFEARPICRSLKLKHYLLKPVQRLPQYKLLLADYVKHLENEGEDYQDSLRALHMITDLLKNANDVIS